MIFHAIFYYIIVAIVLQLLNNCPIFDSCNCSLCCKILTGKHLTITKFNAFPLYVLTTVYRSLAACNTKMLLICKLVKTTQTFTLKLYISLCSFCKYKWNIKYISVHDEEFPCPCFQSNVTMTLIIFARISISRYKTHSSYYLKRQYQQMWLICLMVTLFSSNLKLVSSLATRLLEVTPNLVGNANTCTNEVIISKNKPVVCGNIESKKDLYWVTFDPEIRAVKWLY